MNTDSTRSQRPVRANISSTRNPAESTGVRMRPSTLLQARFRIDGVGSAFDAERLERRLERQVGVIGVSVNPINDIAYITFDPGLTSMTLIQRQIEASGFGACVG